MGHHSTIDLKYGDKPYREPRILSKGRMFRMIHLKSGKVLEDVPEDIVGPGAPAWYSKRGWTVEVVS